MFIAEKYPHQFPFLAKKTKTPLSPSSSLLRSFHTSLASRLRSLSSSAAGNSAPTLPFLIAAISVVSDTISSASPLFLSLSSNSPHPSSALDSSAALLHASNVLSSSLDPFLRHRLLLLFSLSRRNLRDLPQFPNSNSGLSDGAIDLARSLLNSAPPPPSQNSSPIHSAVYAIATLSALVLPFVLSALEKSPCSLPQSLPSLPENLPWGGEYDRLARLISGMSGRAIVEIENVEEAVGKLRKGGHGEGFSETEKLTEEMTVGLDELSKTVYGLFRAALGLRNTALQCFRLGIDE